MSALPVIDIPPGARYVPADWQRWTHNTAVACPWCHRGSQGPHRLAVCLACSTPQCSANPSCVACLHGWLPGWSRGYQWDGDRNVVDRCGYKKCDQPAVADAARVGRVCAAHLDRAKENGRPLADVIAENVDHAINRTGGHLTAWRRLVLREPAR